MSHQPPGSVLPAVANMAMVYGGAVVSNLGHVQLLSTMVPSNAIGAIIHTSSSTSPQDTETKFIHAVGHAYIDFSAGTLEGGWGVLGKTVQDHGNLSTSLSQGATIVLIDTTLVHTLQIENYGGGPGGSLQIWAEDLSSETGNAANRASVEFITS